VSPRADASSFDLTISFGAFPCAIPGLSFSGVAYYRKDLHQLQAAVVNGIYRQAMGFTGIKQKR
jgi:hypothetical protein